ncbi:DUF3040 domain-containing protein [Corynebacterium alimapuense]|uniref:DUF3040 domain-containing protein n=1 Tax=Corynebacterium alimapuense TaxID=1576874 RepID=A0A3M8K9M1_9CORY|nr:DUF3040 domain-containing protein [Corynebacterium alimapuense]RNE49495.1 DUF3040 domain-containing protein [Corynebacterium alimapuense]
MSLSEQEQRVLREIEQSLLAEDPKFGSSVSGGLGEAGVAGLSLRGIAVAVIGLLMLIGGVALAAQSLWFISLSLVGFLVMFGAGVWMLRGGGSVSSTSSRDRGGRKSSGEKISKSSTMEEDFRRRFEGK